MARLRFLMPVVIILLGLVWLTPAAGWTEGARPEGRPPDAALARVNDGLEAWIELIDADRPFLLLNGSSRQLELRHGSAILRTARLLSDPTAATGAVRQGLQARLRRYGAMPFASTASGPFDWEHYLAAAADDDCALWFGDSLLLYADAAWTREAGAHAAVRLAAVDLRALYDAVSDSIEIVLLSPGWDAQTTSRH